MSKKVADPNKIKNIKAHFKSRGIKGFEFSGISKQTIYEIGQEKFKGLKRAFLYDLFLTGGRVSEMLASVKGDRRIEDHYIVTMFNLKNKRTRFKVGIGYLTDKIEKAMVDDIMSAVEKFKRNDPMYRFVYKTRYEVNVDYSKIPVNVTLIVGMNKFNHTIKLFPHIIRHSRAENLVSQYKFSTQELARYMGWSDVRPAMVYVSTQAHDFLRHADKGR